MPLWEAAVYAYLALSLGVILWLAWRPHPAEPEQAEPEAWPRAALIVPLAGSPPDWQEQLIQLSGLDYPDYSVFVVCQEPQSPASRLAGEMAGQHAKLNMVEAADRPELCGSKNRNLLRGIAAAGEGYELYAFMDAGHRAPPDWLRGLARPIALGEARICTAYHRAPPRDHKMTGLAFAWCVGLMGLAQTKDVLRQAWGGSMAVTRAAFEDMQVAKRWSCTVVDDLTLSALAREHGQPIALSPAWLESPAQGLKPKDWRDWLQRQIAFLKFQFPLSWLALGLAGFMMTLCLHYCLFALICTALGWLPVSSALAAALMLFLWIMAGLRLRARFGPGSSAPAWLLAGLRALWDATWCYGLSALGNDMLWHGVLYRVGKGGRVLSSRVMPES